MKFLIGGTIALLALISLFTISHFEGKVIHSYEDDKFCESLELLQYTSILSDDHKLLLGKFYSRGLCVNQDLGKAKALYEKTIKNDIEIGKTFFYDGLEISEYCKRKKIEPDNIKIQKLFKASKQLGFRPSTRELNYLAEYNLKGLY